MKKEMGFLFWADFKRKKNDWFKSISIGQGEKISRFRITSSSQIEIGVHLRCDPMTRKSREKMVKK